jgi:predicted HicB family RNase H-like nuclease
MYHPVITVRLDKELHDALRDMAYHKRTSMNKICVEVLKEAAEKAAQEKAIDEPALAVA